MFIKHECLLVTGNINLDADLASGARGSIVDIVLHPDEPAVDSRKSVTQLQYPPSIILVKLDKTRTTGTESVVPVAPIRRNIRISRKGTTNTSISTTVHEVQLLVTAAYACTGYRAQGQTLDAVIVDLATPPIGGLNLFSLYVALSRSRGRKGIRILRDFDEKWCKTNHKEHLLAEDDRLRELDTMTKRWWNSTKSADVA